MRSNHFLLILIVFMSVLAALSGCVISPRRIVGGSTPTPTASPSVSPSPGVTGKLYVSNQNGNSILRFDNAFTATGNIQPNATISGTNTGLNGPQFLALDTSANRLYVANGNGSSVLIWDSISTTSGNIAPTRSISGPNTGLITPIGIALDASRDLLYVADGTQVFVYSPASSVNGNATPLHDIIIGGANLNGILLDAANNRLYVADAASNAIGIFDNASTLNSTVTSNRAITGAATNLSTPNGMALDAFGNLVVTNQANGTITVYPSAATANGPVAPIVTISGTNTTLVSPGQVILNSASSANEIFVADASANEVVTFSGVNSTGGNEQPSRQIAGSSTTLSGISARGVALDPTR